MCTIIISIVKILLVSKLTWSCFFYFHLGWPAHRGRNSGWVDHCLSIINYVFVNYNNYVVYNLCCLLFMWYQVPHYFKHFYLSNYFCITTIVLRNNFKRMLHSSMHGWVITGTGKKFVAYLSPSPTLLKHEMNIY